MLAVHACISIGACVMGRQLLLPHCSRLTPQNVMCSHPGKDSIPTNEAAAQSPWRLGDSALKKTAARRVWRPGASAITGLVPVCIALAVHSCIIVRVHIMGWWSTGSTQSRRSMARSRATARQGSIPRPRHTTARPRSAACCALFGHSEGRVGTGGHDAAKRAGQHKSPPPMSAQDWEIVHQARVRRRGTDTASTSAAQGCEYGAVGRAGGRERGATKVCSAGVAATVVSLGVARP